MKKTFWKMWVHTNTEKKANEVLKRLAKRMGKQAEVISVEPEEVKGYIVQFTVELESEAWNDQVVEIIDLGQRVASGWGLSGFVKDDLNGWSSSVSDSAVQSICWTLR